MKQMRSVTYEVCIRDGGAALSLLEEVPGFTAGYEAGAANGQFLHVTVEKVYVDPHVGAFEQDLSRAEQILRAAGIRFRRCVVEVTFERSPRPDESAVSAVTDEPGARAAERGLQRRAGG